MEFTGERYVSNLNSAQISYEHWHRYLYATQFIKDKDVLDIACGEGYGANLIAQTAKTVVGVDISKEAIDFAKEQYPRTNLSFLQGSVETIPIDGVKIFDVVVSFETIEHVDVGVQESFLKEVKRLLKDDGVFVVSSPNKLFYSDIPNYKNEFHLREFHEKDFVDFLRQYFEQVSVFGQKVFTGSDMWQLGSSKREGSFVEYQITNDGQRFVANGQQKEALYLLAVCADLKIEAVENSFLVDNSTSILSERDAQIIGLNQAVAEHDAQIINLNQTVAERDRQIATLNQAVAERNGQITGLNQAVAERDGQVAGFKHAVEERDRQIAGLNQAVAERNGQIASFKQALAERDGQIATLNQALAARDTQIYNLNQSMAERNGQIANLSQSVAERSSELGAARNELHSIYTSKKWKLIMKVAAPVLLTKTGISKAKIFIRKALR